MKKYKYIVVDDEIPSHLSVKHYFKDYTNYSCSATFFNPKRAFAYLQNNEIDLIFLDIEMPEMNGFQFVEALEKSIFVVFLTAYPEKYSLDAHRFIDKDMVFFSNKSQFSYYLPKIIARFEKMYEEKMMINRVRSLVKNEVQTFPVMLNHKEIHFNDIIHILVVGHNIVLKMMNGEELIYRKSINELINILPPQIFLQIRRNRIINILHVTSFTNTTVCVENEHFEISLRNRKRVQEILKKQKQLLENDH